MTDPDYLVVLYSKYSPQCKRITAIYNESLMDFIRLVCIDNVKVRQRIQQSKNVQIQSVPCVVFVFPNKLTEIHQNEGITDWIIEQIEKHLPETNKTTLLVQPTPEPVEQSQPIEQIQSRPQSHPQETSLLTIPMASTPEEIEAERNELQAPPKNSSIRQTVAEMEREREAHLASLKQHPNHP